MVKTRILFILVCTHIATIVAMKDLPFPSLKELASEAIIKHWSEIQKRHIVFESLPANCRPFLQKANKKEKYELISKGFEPTEEVFFNNPEFATPVACLENLCAYANKEHAIKLLDSNTKTEITFPAQDNYIMTLTWLPNHKILASGSFDGIIKLWDMNGTCLKTIKSDGHSVQKIKFLPNDNTILATYGDGTVKMWNLTGECLHSLQVSDRWGEIHDLQWLPEKKQLFYASSGPSDPGSFTFWSPNTKTTTHIAEATNGLCALALIKKDLIVVSAHTDHTLKLWHKNGTLLHTLKGHTDKINQIFPLEKHNIIASCSDDKTIRLWETTGKDFKTLKCHEAPIHKMLWLEKPGMLISLDYSNTIKFWTIEGTCIKTISFGTNYISHIVSLPHSNTIGCIGAASIKLLKTPKEIMKALTKNIEIEEALSTRSE